MLLNSPGGPTGWLINLREFILSGGEIFEKINDIPG